MPETSSVEIRLLAQQVAVYPVEMTLAATQQVFRGQVSADLAVWTPGGDSCIDGQALFDALFASADLMRGWGVAHGKAQQVRVQLRIDAPELHQTCIDGRGADYPCGREARAALSDLVSGQTLNCLARDTDRYGRNVATCSIGVRDIADAPDRTDAGAPGEAAL